MKELVQEEFENKYGVFIKGETVDLCVPSKLAIYRDDWWNWFNDEDTTKFLDQGIFPNTIEDQLAFYESLRKRERFALLIRPKTKKRIIGVISLSNINMFKRSAQISMVFGIREKKHSYFALESMARVTEHGFKKMGLSRIYAGQAFPGLKNWNKRLELLGYRSEGIEKNGYIKGDEVSDVVKLACLYENYILIKKMRNGRYWNGEKKMEKLVQSLPERGFAERLNSLIEEESDNYFSTIKYI